MSPIEVVDEMSAVLADPDNWCQGVMAMSGTGDMVSPNNPRARKWCLIGALYKTVGTNALVPGRRWENQPAPFSTVRDAMDRVAVDMGLSKGPMALNDGGTHSQVLEFLSLLREHLINQS